MKKIRNTIKTYSRLALVATHDEVTDLREVSVETLSKPRNEKGWLKLARDFCASANLDFIRFISGVTVKKASYEMDATAFIECATLVTDGEEE